MPKVQIPLGGYSQDPSERNDAPKVARLTNMRLAEPNCLEVAAGEDLVPITQTDGSPLRQIHAMGSLNGTGYAITEGLTAELFNALGFVSAARAGTVWRRAQAESQYLSHIEAPISRLIFSEEQAHYYFPGILDLGGGRYVVVAERATSLIGGPSVSATSFFPQIEWAYVSGGTSLAIVGSGVFQVFAGPNNQHTWMVCAGPYLVLYSDTNTISVLTFNAAAPVGDFTVVKTFAVTQATSTGPNVSLDAALSSDGTRLVIAMGNMQMCVLNTATWATVYLGTPGFVAGTNGTVGVAAGAAGTYMMVHRQAASNNWYAEAFNDAGVISSSSNIYVSGAAAPGTYITSRASVTFSTTGYWCVGIPYVYGTTSTQFEIVNITTAGAVVGIPTRGLSAAPLTKPRVHSSADMTTPGMVTWACDSSGNQGRSLRSVVLLGERDRYGSENYTAQLTQAFRAGDPAPAPTCEHLYSQPSPIIDSAYLPPLINGARRRGWMAAVAILKEGDSDTYPAGSVGTNVWLLTAVDARHDTVASNPADMFQPAEARGRIIVASGDPKSILPKPEMSGFSAPPTRPTLTYQAVGVPVAAGTYLYCLALRNIDARGCIQWSPVSDPVSITTGAAGQILVTYQTFNHQLGTSGTTGANMDVFRTTNGGTVFYRASESTSYSFDFTDTVPDATLITRPILYTQGERSGVSGLLDHFGAPPCRCICSGPDRMLAGGISNEFRVQFSNLFFPSEAISWPQHAAFFADLDSPVTGVYCLDGVWLAFTVGGVFAITGQGPDAQGNGEFDAPRRLTSIGTPSWRSLVEIQAGLCYQSGNGQIYLLQRGSLAVQWLSQPIREAITGSAISQESPLYQANRVMGAVYDRETQTAMFAMQSGGVIWNYSETSGTWFRTVSKDVNAVTLGAWSTELQDLVYSGPAFTYTATPPERKRRIDDAFYAMDSAFTVKLKTVETCDMDLDGGRVRRGWVTIVHEFNISVAGRIYPTVSASWWFDGASHAQSADSYTVITPETYPNFAADRNWEVEICPARQKCNQVRLRLDLNGDSGQRFRVLGFALDVESKAKKIRYSKGSNRG